ncbi:MAG TPA: ATP-binding protein [Candidatus Acidoferrum sp.]|jgi:PAS domain S-box-containing protein|nr:ATP-binding protein [Candidatus Acidoferrum sp.]
MRRLGVRGREALVVSLLTLLVVSTATAIHLSQLSRVVVQEAVKQAELIAKQIYAQTSRALQRTPGADPLAALRDDPELRSFLDASVGYSPHLLYALVTDHTGTVLLHTERQKEGKPEPERPNLDGLLKVDTLSRFSALYTTGRTYETVLPMTLNDRLFGSIRLGVSTTLLRREVTSSLQQSLAVAAVALPLAWLAAMVLAQLTVRPIRAIVGQVDRIRRGEPLEATPVALGGDEFQELSSQLTRLGRELQADRLSTLSEKAHLQGVVDQLEDGVIFLNPERHILFFNRAAETVVGLPLERTVGLPIHEVLDPAHPLLPFVDQVLVGSAGIRNATVVLPHDGRDKEFLVSAFHMEDAHRVMGVAVLLKDLESIKTVQSLVSYSAKLAALGRLTSGVAHEVKNPLNAMMIHVELLKERLEDSGVDVKKSLEVIGGEIRRLDRVVQGFLKFMRPQELTLKPVDLNAMLQSVCALLEAESLSHGVRFVLELDAALPAVSADEELLRQAFINIVQNAVQAMPSGGAVRIRTRPEEVDWVRVTVTDQGVGIAPEDVDKIFKLYYTSKPGGSGIGLSVVYRIVQLHDGTVEAKSELGRGTAVIVRLPVR